jgi:hypothetical protein
MFNLSMCNGLLPQNYTLHITGRFAVWSQAVARWVKLQSTNRNLSSAQNAAIASTKPIFLPSE